MAGILDSVYIVAVVLAAVIGFGIIASTITETDAGTSRPYEWLSLAIGALFVVVLGATFLA